MNVSEPLIRYDASQEEKKKKKREKKIISSDKRSNSSREREALMHCNMLPGTTMHGFGCLHSRKKKIKQRGAEKCCITI